MRGIQALQPKDAILDGTYSFFNNQELLCDEKYLAFNWKNLSDGSIVVDVGGGLGTASLPLARDFPGIQLVVQDLPGVIAEAKQVKENSPDTQQNKLITLV